MDYPATPDGGGGAALDMYFGTGSSGGAAPPSSSSPKAPEWPAYCNPRYVMPATIQVMVPNPDGGRPIRMPVAVQKALVGSKAYLGGFRHKKTGLLYHHAGSQTAAGMDRRDGWVNPESKSHRDTQTYETKTRSVMTGREMGTQMARKDVLLDESRDLVLSAKPYFSGAQLEDLKRSKALILQCYWRGYVARKRCWAIREALYNQFLSEEKALAEAAAAEKVARESEVERRMNPRSAKDFELLYNELEAWVHKEVGAMKAMPELSDGDRKARTADILAKQTKALQTIDRLKMSAARAGKEKRVDKMLGLMAKPKLWELGSGEVQEVHTQFTVRAAELMDLYRGLADINDKAGGLDERLDVLLNVKWTVREFDCVLSRDIVGLCDREAEMLNRGRSPDTLVGLRKRLQSLFLQFIETPDFNPEATRFLKVPPKQSDLKELMSLTA